MKKYIAKTFAGIMFHVNADSAKEAHAKADAHAKELGTAVVSLMILPEYMWEK